jgi:hypothetical protein
MLELLQACVDCERPEPGPHHHCRNIYRHQNTFSILKKGVIIIYVTATLLLRPTGGTTPISHKDGLWTFYTYGIQARKYE